MSTMLHLMITPTPANLRYLADLADGRQLEPVYFNMTEDEYHNLPCAGDLRRSLFINDTIFETERVMTSANLDQKLRELRREYNIELGGQTGQHYDGVVPFDEMPIQQVSKLLSVIARCTDEDDRIRPWERSTSVTEALQDMDLKPEDIFTKTTSA